ncbi:NAD(P)-dependent oxidoreductase [Saccharomonospora piscinae]|uniref:NAD(P)-dependent oxidoreductase n=1 Tax=Saccharomonospora piscinae TaxID=687388 RepID=UPI000464ED38|nr:NAD(P)H-binding protein [Saccharomonospora piscinae]
MRITVFGATGQIGGRIVAEALARGHDVSAVVRSEARASSLPDGVTVRVGDATSAEEVATRAAGSDLVVGATRPPSGDEHELTEIATALLSGVDRAGARLLLVGGAGRLRVPDGTGLVVDDPRFVAQEWRAIAKACVDQHECCLSRPDVDWTYVSPPARIAPGTRTGRYRTGTDVLLVDERGRSAISTEDFAVAVLDEAEHARYRGGSFTVAY